MSRTASSPLPGIAVVGDGARRQDYARDLHALGALRVVVDDGAEPPWAAAPAWGDEVDVERDPASVLTRDDVQGVVIASPAERGFRLANECLRAGKDVLVEMPLTPRVAEAGGLVRTAREFGRMLMIGYPLEYHPAALELGRLVSSGALGTLQYVHSTQRSRHNARRAESALWSLAPDHVALLLRLVGQLPETVSATVGVAGVTVTQLAFPGGVRGHLHVSRLQPFDEQKLELVGDKAMAVFDAHAGELLWYEHPKPAQARRIDVGRGQPLRAEYEAFLRAIETREPALTDGESGLRVLTVLSRCQESLEQAGRVVPLDAPSYFAHPSAVVDEGARIGDRTRIWHFCHVMSGAQLGERCVLGQNVFVAGGVRIGDGVKIQNNVSVYRGVTLEDDVFCGPSMVFTNVRNPRGHVERKDAFEATRVCRGATLGANCTIVCGNRIGRYAMVAAGAVVTGDVPDHALVVGVPARVVGWMSPAGHRLPIPAEQPSGPVTCEVTGVVLEPHGAGLRVVA